MMYFKLLMYISEDVATYIGHTQLHNHISVSSILQNDLDHVHSTAIPRPLMGLWCKLLWDESLLAAAAATVVATVDVLAVQVPAGEHVEEETGTDADSQVNGVMPSAREQPDALQQVECVVERRQPAPSHAAHIHGRDYRAGDMPGVEEEEGHVPHGEVHPGAQELRRQGQLRGAAEQATAGEHHERGDGGAGPLLGEDGPQNVGGLHRDEHLHMTRSHVPVSMDSVMATLATSGNCSGDQVAI